MLIGDTWKEYQTKDYWGSKEATEAGFWTPASKAFAYFATGEVLVYLSAAADTNKRENSCKHTWNLVERPVVLQGLADGRITSIVKYISPSRTPVGNIGAGFKDSCDNCDFANPMSCNDKNCQGINGLPNKTGTCMTDQYAGCPCKSICPSGTLSCTDKACAGANGRCKAGEYNGCACQEDAALQAAKSATPTQATSAPATESHT
jgi:hypothetical protein